MVLNTTRQAQEFIDLQGKLAREGVRLRITGGEYSLNYTRGSGKTERTAETLDEARDIGRELIAARPPYLPPVAPTGGKRGQMYRHNAKLARRGFWERGGRS